MGCPAVRPCSHGPIALVLVAALVPPRHHGKLLLRQLGALALGADAVRCNAQARAHGGNEAVQRESQYNRGFRHGYNRRDAEVKGALA